MIWSQRGYWVPLSKHYGGKGRKVYLAMKKTYGDKEKAEQVFYATENKMKKNRKKKMNLAQKGY